MDNPKYTFRSITSKDYEFIYQVKKTAYKKYVEMNWGSWEEEEQRRLFAQFISTNKDETFIIVHKGKEIGFYNGKTLSNEKYEVGNICIIPEFQRKGIGTAILMDVLSENRDKEISIQYFKQNPVGELYERLGFKSGGETVFHYQMTRTRQKQ